MAFIKKKAKSKFGKFSKFSKFSKGGRDGDREKTDRDGDRDSGKLRFIRKKVCRFCGEKVDEIDYKDTTRLMKFISERGKIIPSRVSGNCAKHQRLLARAIKRGRQIALIPFTR